MTANQSVLTSKKPKEPSRKVSMNELKVVFNRVSIYDPLISKLSLLSECKKCKFRTEKGKELPLSNQQIKGTLRELNGRLVIFGLPSIGKLGALIIKR